MSQYDPEYIAYCIRCIRRRRMPVEYGQYTIASAAYERTIRSIRALRQRLASISFCSSRCRQLTWYLLKLRQLELSLNLEIAYLGEGGQPGMDATGHPDPIQPRPAPRAGADALSMQELAEREDWRFEIADAIATLMNNRDLREGRSVNSSLS